MTVIAIYFIPHIQLDSTLKGGVSVQVETNSTLNPITVTTLVDSKIPCAEASVSRSPGGLSITLAENTSIASAETNLLSFYSAYSNYTAATYNVSAIQVQLTTEPTNTTLQGLLTTSQTEQQKSIPQFTAALSAELLDLKPFIGTVNYNASNYASLPNVAKNTYSNASLVRHNQIISALKSVLPFTSYSYNEVTPTLGAFFLSEMETIIIVAFILVAIVVFVIFRTPVPAFAVVFGAQTTL